MEQNIKNNKVHEEPFRVVQVCVWNTNKAIVRIAEGTHKYIEDDYTTSDEAFIIGKKLAKDLNIPLEIENFPRINLNKTYGVNKKL